MQRDCGFLLNQVYQFCRYVQLHTGMAGQGYRMDFMMQREPVQLQLVGMSGSRLPNGLYDAAGIR